MLKETCSSCMEPADKIQDIYQVLIDDKDSNHDEHEVQQLCELSMKGLTQLSYQLLITVVLID